eukprot:6464486-Amphidinium_carterae.1
MYRIQTQLGKIRMCTFIDVRTRGRCLWEFAVHSRAVMLKKYECARYFCNKDGERLWSLHRYFYWTSLTGHTVFSTSSSHSSIRTSRELQPGWIADTEIRQLDLRKVVMLHRAGIPPPLLRCTYWAGSCTSGQGRERTSATIVTLEIMYCTSKCLGAIWLKVVLGESIPSTMRHVRLLLCRGSSSACRGNTANSLA